MYFFKMQVELFEYSSAIQIVWCDENSTVQV